MSLRYLEVSSVRNLTSLSITPSPTLNILYGANGSGKSSVLEAIHILGLGRSFRTLQARKLVQDGYIRATVFGKVDRNGLPIGVGIQKSQDGETVIKVDGCVVSSAANLAELLPLQVLTPDSHELLQGEPKERRAFLDWGLFHVEHNYLELWRRYRRVLQQRNAGLRGRLSQEEIGHWDAALADCGEKIAVLRAHYLSSLSGYFLPLYARLVGSEETVELAYRRGWTKELPLAAVLKRNYDSEIATGYTMAGPHRADFRVLVAGADAVDRLSRGQQKLAVCALRLAQARHLAETQGRVCTFLVDDLPAELDPEKRELLLSALVELGGQCFVTATERQLVEPTSSIDCKVFHVERGAVAEVI